MGRPLASPCASCHNRCCFEYTVTVTGYDAWLIATSLQLAPEQFLVCLAQEEPAPESFHLQAAGAPFVIALAKVGDNGDERCAFWLSLPEGHGRCGIYAVRPHVCRTYPAYLRDGIVHLRQNVMCPAGAWNLPGMDVPAWRLRLMRFQLEQSVYCAVVDTWNGHVDASAGTGFPLAAFYAYLMRVYNRLEQVRTELTAEGETALLEHCSSELEDGRDFLAEDTTHESPVEVAVYVAGVRAALDSALPVEAREQVPMTLA